MKFAAGIATLCLLLPSLLPAAETPAETAPVILKTATDGRREVTVELRNPAETPAEFRVAAGTIYRGAEGARLITLREATASLPPRGAAELAIPAAELGASSPAPKAQSAQPTGQTEPKLAPLLEVLKTANDVPRLTSQCAVLALLEDIDFAQWQQFVAAGRPAGEADEAAATTDALLGAVDTVAILHTLAPAQSFRLAADPELKLRALRQPGLRAKALQIFGMTIPGDAPLAGTGAAPELGQLLHTKPGDNCPICRMRAQMQRPASDL